MYACVLPTKPPYKVPFILISSISICFFFFFIRNFSHFYVGLMYLMRRLHLAGSCASSLDNSLSNKSFLMLSNHLRFGLPLLLFPGTSIAITLLPTYSYSLLNTCPYHFNLLSCSSLDISPTFVVPLILSFLILPSLVTPLIHLNILISATSNFFFVLSSLPKSRHRASLLVLQLSCILSLDSQTYSSVAQNPRYHLPVFQS